MKPKTIYESRVLELEKMMCLIYHSHEEFSICIEPEDKAQLHEDLNALISKFKREYRQLKVRPLSDEYSKRLESLAGEFNSYE
jgi:hypothetical protein